MLAPRPLPRAQMTRLSWILGIWFTYYVPVLINFMTSSKHLSIAYQGINLRRLLRLPPTQGALREAIVLTDYQTMVWNNKVPKPNIPSPENYGWKKDSKEWPPVMTTTPPAPEVVIEMVKCACVKQQCSTNRCQCRKARLTCTKFAHALMMTSPVKILCRKMMVMNILMKMMKVTITMIIQVMMMNTINVFIEFCLYHTFKGRLITV